MPDKLEVDVGDSYCIVCHEHYTDDDGSCFSCMELERAYMASEPW